MALDSVQLQILADEITNDPLSRGYNVMDPQQVADDLKIVYRSRIKSLMTSTEIFNAVDIDEFMALADGHRSNILGLLAFGSLNPAGREATVFTRIFGAQSQTIQTLAQERQEPVSRAVELGIDGVRASDVEAALND